MATCVQRITKTLMRSSACGLLALSLAGCSVFQSESHLVQTEPAVSPQALASAEGAFVAEPFSLVAADSVGLAIFGFEIAQWGETPGHDALAQQH